MLHRGALTHDLCVHGNPVVELVHSSDNPYVDVFVRVSEVDAKGRSRNVSDGYRRLGDAPELVRVELDAIAHRFRADSRIRVLIAGSWFPAMRETSAPRNRYSPDGSSSRLPTRCISGAPAAAARRLTAGGAADPGGDPADNPSPSSGACPVVSRRGTCESYDHKSRCSFKASSSWASSAAETRPIGRSNRSVAIDLICSACALQSTWRPVVVADNNT